MKEAKNFLEMETLEGANQVDMDMYRFERYSETRGYIFVKRRGK